MRGIVILNDLTPTMLSQGQGHGFHCLDIFGGKSGLELYSTNRQLPDVRIFTGGGAYFCCEVFFKVYHLILSFFTAFMELVLLAVDKKTNC